MHFELERMLLRYEFFSGMNQGPCGLVYGVFRLCVNTVVLTLVLTCVDTYFTNMTSIVFRDFIRVNAIVSVTGLLIMRGTFLALNN